MSVALRLLTLHLQINKSMDKVIAFPDAFYLEIKERDENKKP